MAKERKASYESTYRRNVIIGVALCICCPIPLLISAFAETDNFIVICMVCVLLTMVAAAVFIFIQTGTIMESYQALLEEGEFEIERKAKSKKLAPFATIFWCLATALFLYRGFMYDAWKTSWIIWPIAGVLYVVYIRIVKLFLKMND